MALWGGRFSQESSALFKLFNDSLPVDFRLIEQDIIGSIAWASAITQVGILTEQECSDLHQALNELLGETIDNPQLIIASGRNGPAELPPARHHSLRHPRTLHHVLRPVDSQSYRTSGLRRQ